MRATTILFESELQMVIFKEMIKHITSRYAVTHFIPNQTWLGISYALFRYALYTAFYTSAVTQYMYDVVPV